MENMEINNFINEFSSLEEVQSIVLGGSKANGHSDNKIRL